jgi:precorrin-6B methylase 2
MLAAALALLLVPQTGRSPAELVAELEKPARAVFRYRVAIVKLLELKPGMAAADIGAGSGFIARLMAADVGPTGRVMAIEADPALAAYVAERVRADGIQNISVVAQPSRTASAPAGLDPSSLDAVAMVEALSTFDRPREILQSILSALKPGGLMLIVDTPREGQGAAVTGIEADDVVALAASAGFTRLDEIGIVPGHYALRFRKPKT